MINSVDNITNKCRVICRHCFCARGLFFSRTVALVTRHAHLGGCLPETHLPVLVMIISVPSSWNLSHKSLVSRRHSTPASSRLHAGDVVVETSSLSASTSVTPSTFTLLGLASEWSSTNFSENREYLSEKFIHFLNYKMAYRNIICDRYIAIKSFFSNIYNIFQSSIIILPWVRIYMNITYNLHM